MCVCRVTAVLCLGSATIYMQDLFVVLFDKTKIVSQCFLFSSTDFTENTVIYCCQLSGG